ncbi:hypothetical protein VNI00_008524 [Paramarasmius palmivorus]|uniref:Protein kinase domain-containing protein n=1 Tax=Paramarasmius palmivorus TaxID=297713 RepID=A0AAW0CXX0_9AGAR
MANEAASHSSPSFRVGGLAPSELFWRDHQKWLEERGYMLRPRYHPGWTPSWTGTNKRPHDCEDGPLPYKQMDARRISDDTIVILKRVSARESSDIELKMAPLFSTEPYASDARNHCIPIYETLEIPNTREQVILVMPCLRSWEHLPFDTIGEVVEFCRQTFEGLQFMHEHHIAHNDVKFNNILMDSRPLYDQPMHPVKSDRTYDWKRRVKPKGRTRRPVQYYYIDFDLCEQYNPAVGKAQKVPGYGGDRALPEFKHSDRLCDPFAVDVYRLGNIIRSRIVGGSYDSKLPRNPAFAFMQPLLDDMTQENSEKRPNMDQVVKRFTDIVASLNQWKLRSPAQQNRSFTSWVVNRPLHWSRQFYYLMTRVPAIPTP